MNIGSRIKARRRELGFSAEELAERTGLSPATIYRYESAGIANMGADKLLLISDALSTTPACLMGWAQEAPVPAETPQESTPRRSDQQLTLRDDSMAPRLLPGDLIFLRRENDVRDGDIAAVELDGSILLRRIYRRRQEILLIADNPAFLPISLDPTGLNIIGRAAAYRREL